MLKKTMTYTDFNGNTRTEDFYFNLTKAELLEMETSKDGGLTNFLQKIVNEQSVPKIMDYFKTFILMSYGQKSDDGRRFIKNAELREEFSQTEAYSDLYVKLATDADEAAKFVNSVIPQDMAKEIAAQTGSPTNLPAA